MDKEYILVTAGSTYLDIDAYACMIAMEEFLQVIGENAIAYSIAPCNYSVCKFLIKDREIHQSLPVDVDKGTLRYIIVDVSDPEFLEQSIPLDQIIEIYDHHVGFEDYWKNRIGNNACIEFVGAAATLIYRRWKAEGIESKMSRHTTLLLIAAILDNTLNLTSDNTTNEDTQAFMQLCQKEGIDEEWCASYFSEVQRNVEADLKNALFGDMKTISNSETLPPRFAQLCVWDVNSILERLKEIRLWLNESDEKWIINIVGIKDNCSFLVCDYIDYQKKIEKIFDSKFEFGIARLSNAYLRKEIIKKAYSVY